MSAYDKLYYNRVDLAYDGSQIRVAPNFRCPVCSERPEALLEKTWNVNLNRELNVNTQVTYTMPCCQTPITMYAAVYKARNSPIVRGVLAVDPIAEDWWAVDPVL